MHRRDALSPRLLLPALLLALVGATQGARAATLTRAPYLQNVKPDAATVAFRMSGTCAATVRYGKGSSTDLSANAGSSAAVQAVTLRGLEPATRYSYVVDACGSSSPAKSFVTAPLQGTQKVHFAAVGDFGTGGTQEKQVADAMLALHPELFVALGDNAYDAGTEAQFQTNLFAPMAGLLAEVPLFPSVGNHEYVTNEAQPYLDNFYLPTNNALGSERFYSFDWGFIHFVSLDSNCALGMSGADKCTLAAQKAFVEQDLAASTAAWKVVFFHHPPFSSGDHGSQLTMRREFGPLFEKYGVDLVLTGHDHNYERSYPMKGDNVASSGGIPYLVVGSGGATLRPFTTAKPSWSAVRNDTDYGFLDVNVEGGTLQARFLNPSGRVVDSFTLTKQVAAPPSAASLSVAVDKDSGTAPHQAQFTATTSLSNPTLNWSFGDGGTSTGAQASHTFTEPGQYTVSATATSGAQSVTRSLTVLVVAPGQPLPPSAGGGVAQQPPAALNPSDGAQSGGCSASPAAALLPVAGLLAAGFARRRRRRA
ncbi:PKD domain-containing protein [Aggregicoccus sp. 17bor-14]|uniref:metallophosphoesterase n=1 Tax=Myxococcaceae TaxID=31 RepID=UPI00129C3FE8|nr:MULTISPECIES: metallophosphoesterase [Myxococcaceae]MBF5041498.1 metallophosphoesterase [Simulacricoccus sp. 17bor-14]MRI87282.1 PKD domain-containing protein [Aggregicoccus sp. 17bor-14]